MGYGYTAGFRPMQNIEPIEMPAAVSQTIAYGDAVILDGDGRLSIGLAGSAALYGVAAQAIVTTTPADDTVKYKVWPAIKGAKFIGICSGTLTEAMNGDMVDIIGATGAMKVDEDAAATKVLQILRPLTEFDDAIGAGSPVVFVVAKSQYDGIEV